MSTLREKDLLKLMRDGPTLQQLAERISREFSEEVSSRSVGELLVTLQDRGYVFLEEGRWWRTPEGIALLEEFLAEEERTQEKKKPKGTTLVRARARLKQTPKDLIVALIMALLTFVLKFSFAHAYLLPGWDGSVYLLNARRFLYGYDPLSFFELLRPPLLPGIIALFWGLLGESYPIAASIQPIFTVLASLILYVTVREMFGWKTAVLSFLVFLFAPEIFRPTNLLLTHGVMLPFVLLSFLFAWRTHSRSEADNYQYVYAVIVGLSAALASLTRYPSIVFLPAILVLVSRRNIIWSLKWILVCGLSFLATWAPWLQWNIVNAGGDPFASVKAAFSVGAFMGVTEAPSALNPWYYYLTGLVELISVVGVALLVVGVANKEAFKDRRVLAFFCWFAVAMTASSALENKQLRFMIEWFPAISVLVALGVRRIQRSLSTRPKAVFNLLVACWFIYLIWSSNLVARADVDKKNGPEEREFSTVASWVTANTARTDICASDSPAPQFSYFTRRLFYSFDYLEEQSILRRLPMGELLARLNVTYVVVTSQYAQTKNFSRADYLATVKKFEYYVAYSVIGGTGPKHQGILIVTNNATTTSSQPQPGLVIQETVRGSFPYFDRITSNSFFTRLEDAYAKDGNPRYGLIILSDEVWSESSGRLSLTQDQLSVLRGLVERHGVALLTSGRSTGGWLSETYGIRPNGTSTFTAFEIGKSEYIPGWSNLLGNDTTWNTSSPSQLLVFSVSPLYARGTWLETIVETKPDKRPLVWAGYRGKGRVVYFCCSASDLSFDRKMNTVNPALIRALFWLLGDYPRVVKGTGFKVALRIDDAQNSLYASIEKHASALLYERGVPMSLAVIPLDITNATAALLLRLREKGCELTLHGAPGHFYLVTMKNQTQALLEGRERFKKMLGFYPAILVPPGLSQDIETVRAAEAVGFRAMSSSTIENVPAGTRGNHFGYPYSNSTVVMLPVLPLLDIGPYAGWAPSADVAIARTKWLLASQRWLQSSCIVTFHFNDDRLPEIARLVDWAKSIGAQFTTMEQMLNDTFMSPTLEQYGSRPDESSFSRFDMLWDGSKISFILNHPIKLRINMGKEIEYYTINEKMQKTRGPMIVTDVLEAGTEYTVLIQIKSETSRPST